jgi:hypothetical protein
MLTALKPIRSPSYPVMPLSEAIAGVRKIESLYRLSQVDRAAAAKLIGYTSLSGPANKALAALAQYGLVERAGKGEMRVTERAKAILHPDNDDEKRQHLRMAALEPQLFRELQERWPNMIPPEDGIATYLSRQGFNQTAIRPATKAYLQTLLFLEEAGASESHRGEKARVSDAGGSGGNGATYGGACVGDYVDYENGGAIANPEPMRVRAVTEDQAWVFVDDSETGLEMDQVIVRERPETDAKPERPILPLPKAPDAEEQLKPGSRKAIFPLDDGDVALIFPEGISTDGLVQLGLYLDIFLKKEAKKKEGAA